MKRILISLILAGAATAVAQDDAGTYDVTCDGEVVGTATVTGDVAEVEWHGSVQCENPYAIDELDSTLHFGEEGITLVPAPDESTDDGVEEPVEDEETAGTDEDAEDADGEKDADGEADDEVVEKLTGLDRADQVAGENGAHGRSTARAAQGLDGDDEAKYEKDDEKEEDEKDDDEKDEDEDEEDADAEADGKADAEIGVGLGRR